jgi:cytochrome c oxidase cbb3-type subunit I/II
MPPYDWLLTRDLDLESLSSKLRALRSVGVPYSDAEIDRAAALAQTQAREIAVDVAANGGPAGLESKEIVALVAYLQRLGSDVRSGS